MHRVILFYFYFLRTGNAGGGGGGALPDFFLFFPCSADHEWDWPLCKVFFFGLATKTLNVRNSNNNNILTSNACGVRSSHYILHL